VRSGSIFVLETRLLTRSVSPGFPLSFSPFPHRRSFVLRSQSVPGVLPRRHLAGTRHGATKLARLRSGGHARGSPGYQNGRNEVTRCRRQGARGDVLFERDYQAVHLPENRRKASPACSLVIRHFPASCSCFKGLLVLRRDGWRCRSCGSRANRGRLGRTEFMKLVAPCPRTPVSWAGEGNQTAGPRRSSGHRNCPFRDLPLPENQRKSSPACSLVICRSPA
jgi:hypothetical protein